MNSNTDETIPFLPTHSLKFRSNLGPFLSSKSSLEDIFESGSSRPQSLTSHEMSVFSTSSEGSNEPRKPQVRGQNRTGLGGLDASRRNTRELVHLFERSSLDGHPAQASSQPLRQGGFKRTGDSALTKSKPLRESLRNLVLVFNKAKRTLGEPSASRKKSVDKGEIQQQLPAPNPSFTDNKALLATNMPPPTLSHIAPSLPQDIRNGIILFYDESVAVWHRCNAFLAPPNLRLSYFLTSGKPVTRIVPVGKADDARSATIKSSSMTQPPLLDGKTPHIFQVEFRDGTIQTLAACSVLERGGWISAIWDAIIMFKSTAQSRSYPTEVSSIDEGNLSQQSDVESCHLKAIDSSSRNSQEVALVIPPVLPLRTKSSKSSQSRWSTSEFSIESGPMNTSRSVKQRVALFNGLSDAHSVAADVYATPPRTPPRLDARQSHRTSLSKRVAIRNLSAHASDGNPELLETLDSIPESLFLCEERNGETASINSYSSPLPPPMFSDSVPEYQTPSIPLHLSSSGTMCFHNLPPGKTAQEPPMLEPGLEVIHQSAHVQSREYEKLRRRVSNMHQDVKLAIQQPPLPVPQLDELRERVDALADGLHSADLHGLHEKLAALQNSKVGSEEAEALPSSTGVVLEEIHQLSSLVQELKEQQCLVKPEIENMRATLETIQEQTAENDLPPPVPAKDGLPDPLVALQSPLQAIESKLAALELLISDMKGTEEGVQGTEPLRSLSVFRSRSRKDPPEEPVASSNDDQQANISEILSIVTEEREQHTKVAEQFEDSIRYLNELNTWMEAFVTKTAGHEDLLHAISSTLEKLTGTTEEVEKDGEGTEYHNESTSGAAGTKNDTLLELKAALGDFTNALNDFKSTQGTANILATIEKNRAEQEALLRHIAGELSADIRGDRLRFVEAMREATTINVSIHLDEFKQRLSEEVSTMLHDVGRIARDRERKYLEQEIQDIFHQQQQQQQQQHATHRPPPNQHYPRHQHPQLPPPPPPQQQQHYPPLQQQQPQGQMDRQRSSFGFQPLPPRSLPPSRPVSAGPYPAFMMPPTTPSSRAGMHTPGPVPALLRPMPLHPDLVAGMNTQRPLPSPIGIDIHSVPTPTPTPDPPLDATPTRRKA